MVVKSKAYRRRYIAFLVVSEKPLNKSSIISKIRDIELEIFGARGVVFPVGFNGIVLVLRVPHRVKDNVINALRSLDNVYGIRVTIFPLTTSGTIKTLMKRLEDMHFPIEGIRRKKRKH
ncbi:MAG: hypothetical protein DRN30_02640 [Thermoplasmata archaeon]|nr:hypothetical protein [Euryarchaeota archaeon]RLF66151.1 MAG: hypothetical protein DRN30_02640 [Thermoplasmata archaeon]